MRLIVPADEVVLIEVAKVKVSWAKDWRGSLAEPTALWEGAAVAEALHMIERLPASKVYRCFTPGFGIRLHSETSALAEVLFCFHCHNSLTLDLRYPEGRQVYETFNADSDPGRTLLARFIAAS